MRGGSAGLLGWDAFKDDQNVFWLLNLLSKDSAIGKSKHQSQIDINTAVIVSPTVVN